jgi:hypothetical protein
MSTNHQVLSVFLQMIVFGPLVSALTVTETCPLLKQMYLNIYNEIRERSNIAGFTAHTGSKECSAISGVFLK